MKYRYLKNSKHKFWKTFMKKYQIRIAVWDLKKKMIRHKNKRLNMSRRFRALLM